MAEKVEVVITGKDELSGKLGGIQSALTGLGDVAKKVALGGLAILGAGIVGVGSFLASSVGDAMEAQDALTQLDAILQSTGGSAGLTRDQLTEMASALQLTTKFSDDSAMAAETVLLQFDKIGKDVFPDVLDLSADLATRMGSDLPQAANLLGKALADPAEGIGRLNMAYKLFNDEEMKSITDMAKAGDVAGAQTKVMDRLREKIGGAADAAGKTFGGQLEILKNQFGEVKERIGGALLPALTKLATMFKDKLADPKVQAFIERLATNLEKLAGIVGDAISRFAETGDIMDFFTVFEDGSSFIGSFLETLGMSEEKAQQWAEGISKAANWVRDAFTTVAKFVTDNWETIKTVLIAVGAVLAGAGIVSAITSIVAAVTALASPIGLVIGAVALLAAAWANDWGGIQEKVAAVWAFLQPIFSAIWSWLSTNIPLAIQALSAFWTNTLLPAIQSVVSFVQTYVFPVFQAIGSLLGAVGNVVSAILAVAFRTLWGILQTQVMPVVKALFDWFNKNLKPIFEAVGKTIAEKFVPFLKVMADVFWKIVDAVEAVVDWLNELASVIAGITLPPELTPGSPTPFEMGLRGISDALREVITLTDSAFGSNINLPVPATAQAGAGSPGKGSGSIGTNYFYGPVTFSNGAQGVSSRDVLRRFRR